MTAYPRVEVHSTALQLLQILDKRFFGNVGPLESEGDKGRTDFLLYNFMIGFFYPHDLIAKTIFNAK